MAVVTGPGKREVLTFTVHEQTEYGPVEDRGIQVSDWRDPDLVQKFGPTFRVCPLDEGFLAHSGSAEPNWHLGAEIRNLSTNAVVMRFEGDPGEFFKECHRRGLAVEGALIGVDYQRHN